jgi:hypothetical protein
LGGPLFASPSWPDFPENTAANVAEAEQVDPEAEEIERLLNLRRRPSKLADALTRKAYRDYNRMQVAPSVKWVKKAEGAKTQAAKLDPMTAALDDAEALGKKRA